MWANGGNLLGFRCDVTRLGVSSYWVHGCVNYLGFKFDVSGLWGLMLVGFGYELLGLGCGLAGLGV